MLVHTPSNTLLRIQRAMGTGEHTMASNETGAALDIAAGRESRRGPIDPPWPEQGRTAIVIAGAGARGAYEAGVLAELLPALFPAGLGDAVLLGTSAGAVNAALWAQYATRGRSLQAVGTQVCEFWYGLNANKVYTPMPLGLLKRALRLEWLRGRVDSLFETAPLRSHAQATIKSDAIQRNVEDQSIAGVGIVATACPSDGSGGRSRVFLQCSDRVPSPRPDETSVIDYVDAELTSEHVLASAAIPVLFPPVHVSTPIEVAGYYCDGGVRLNTPIKPALSLCTQRLIVVSSHATAYPTGGSIDERRDIVDAAAQGIHAMLADGMIEDLRALRRVNQLVRQARQAGIQLINDFVDPPTPYLEMPVVCVSPRPGRLAKLAREVISAPSVSRNYRRFEYCALRTVFAGAGRGMGNDELLSYLFFDEHFARKQMELGRQDARNILDQLRRYSSVAA
jgi:NTE family protein